MILFIFACGSPTHLQYDHGRAFYAAMEVQSNTARASVINELYPLSGVEAQAIRTQSEEATSTNEDHIETLKSEGD
jgi:hypothetical protein